MKIAVRMDDITPDMDWRRFEEFKALLDRNQVKPLIGIIPYNQDQNLNKKNDSFRHPEFWRYMRELKSQGWIIAMHGCRHVYTSPKGGLFPLNNFSEFAGLDYETQKAMLLEGKTILQEKGIYTDIFMAHAHSYDINTLRALKDIGFNRLTDGFGRRPYVWHGMIFYPVSFRLEDSLRKKKGTTTMVVHANTINGEDQKRYVGYFEDPGRTEWISYSEYMEQEPVIRRLGGRLAEYCAAKVKFWLVKKRAGLGRSPT